jgi:uncharacterized protein YqiB (DUF1249 family)
MLVEAFQTDTNCTVSWRDRPGSFVSLMTLYESNYIRLAWLVPNLDSIESQQISMVESDCPLYLGIEDRSRYTTTLRLTYVFDEQGESVADPDLRVRIYHDAHLAEARSCARWHRHSMLESIRSQLARDLSDRWQRNIMLNKWLDYCVERGHRFPGASSP